MYVGGCEDVHRGKESLDTPGGGETKMVMSHTSCVLGIELWSFIRAV